MSLPSATEAISFSNKVRENARKRIEHDIDQDVQTIVSSIEHLIKETEPNENGIYTLKVLIKSILYPNKQIVMDRVTSLMIGNNYKASVEKKNRIFNNCYILNFRPMTDSEINKKK